MLLVRINPTAFSPTFKDSAIPQMIAYMFLSAPASSTP
jgi:hypothetical protein